MTISQESLPRLASDVIYLHSLNVPFTFDIAQGIPWTIEDTFSYEKQLRKIVNYYESNPEILPNDFFLSEYSQVLVKRESILKNSCGAGVYLSTYDTDGTQFPCQMFATNVQNYKGETICLSQEKFLDPDCEDCYMVSYCPNCYGLNLKERGDIVIRDARLCAMHQARTKVILDFQLKRYETHPPSQANKDMLNAKGFIYAYEHFNDYGVFRKAKKLLKCDTEKTTV